MSPFSQDDGYDSLWLIDEPVPSITAVVDEFVVGFEDVVRQPVVAHELPNFLDRVELR